MKDTVGRPLADMIEALRRHTRLLKEYWRLAFDEQNRDYRGEVAAKLRLLLLPGPEAADRIARNNKPLLRLLRERLGLAGRLDNEILAGITLDGLLRREFIVERDGEFLGVLTNEALINAWATQHGAAHEDWAFKGTFAHLHPRGDAETNPLDLAAPYLSLIAEATIEACEILLATIDQGEPDGPTR